MAWRWGVCSCLEGFLEIHIHICAKDADSSILSIFQTFSAVSLVIVVVYAFVIRNHHLTIRGGALSEELD